jgi:hypothetical protein
MSDTEEEPDDQSYLSYRVTWAIDIDATSPEDAVKQAYEIMEDQILKESDNPIFEVEGPEEEFNEGGETFKANPTYEFEFDPDRGAIKR